MLSREYVVLIKLKLVFFFNIYDNCKKYKRIYLKYIWKYIFRDIC